ncbi:MAG: DUF962 domain-containing protein [Betaproteobacteria bacterium]|nr:DUF962 domain-containing protein [Betaproteobacteria bacterium]
MSAPYRTFREFYPFYLSEHTHPTCRTLHFVGSILVLLILATGLLTGNAWWFAGIPLAGYGFAWLGHFAFEKNRPASFTQPFYSFAGDWVMFYELLTGKIPFNARARG